MKNVYQNIAQRIKISHVIIIWFILSSVSAFFTGLYSDEAYYTLYSEKLSFGYFDHPPLIALMIKAGLFIFRNEFGVRLLPVVAFTVALYIIYKLSEVDKPFLFLITILSVFGLNVIGFLALPDSPLLLFAAMFFAAYKSFLKKEDIAGTLFLGLTISGMLYSKYHGVLIIAFVVFSNLRLLRSQRFWWALIFAFLLFLPHIIWQFRNGFVTIGYHLFERSESSYRISYTLEYITGQLLYYGPFSAIIMFLTASRFRTRDMFEKALSWNLWGFLLFFLICTFKGRVEVNWTLPVLIPLVIFFLRSEDLGPVTNKVFFALSIPVIFLILIIRVAAIYPGQILKISRINDFKGHKEFAQEVTAKSQGLPLITNTYQRAGLLSFYTEKSVPSNNLNSRRNQFNLWHSDNCLRFKKVAYINNYLPEGSEIQNPFYYGYKVSIIDSLPVMNDIRITATMKQITSGPHDSLKIKVNLYAGSEHSDYRDAGKYVTRLQVALTSGREIIDTETCPYPVNRLLENEKGEYEFHLLVPEHRGHYKVTVCLNTKELGIWSNKKILSLKEK